MNSEELLSQWRLICSHILEYEAIDPSQMNAFFSRLQPQAMSDGFLMLTADNDFIKAWIERHYLDYIKQALRDVNGLEYLVVIEVDINQESSANTAAKQTAATAPKPAATVERTKPLEKPVEKIEPETHFSDGPLKKNASEETSSQDASSRDGHYEENQLSPVSTLTFENFVIGESNRMAYSMSVAVAEEPGRQMLNPLFIYGKSGLGKTHLMRSIQNYLSETRPDLRTVYVDSADFLSGYVEATVAHDKEKASFKKFKTYYQDADVLLIDDIQFLQGKEQTLDIVFQIFNALVDEGRQVVLSADRAPKNITMDERYQSRFNSGGTFDIQPPEIETKLGIIKSFIQEYQETSGSSDFMVPDEIQRYIAENSSSNIRELKSAVTKVIYAMNAFNKRDISIDEVSRLLENHFSGGAMKKLTISDIQKEVEHYYDVSHSDLIGAKRSRKIVYARQIAIYLSRNMLDLTYNHIAKAFGGRDHTTIMYSVTNVEEKAKESRELREELENIRRRIRER